MYADGAQFHSYKKVVRDLERNTASLSLSLFILVRKDILESKVFNKISVDISPVLQHQSFECRKVIGFSSIMLHDWLKKLVPLFHPIRSESKTISFPARFSVSSVFG